MKTISTLDRSNAFQPYRIEAVRAPDEAPEWHDWLQELGFIPGEKVMVMAHAPGGDPLVVRVGSSTFALRRAEAACIEVTPIAAEALPA